MTSRNQHEVLAHSGTGGSLQQVAVSTAEFQVLVPTTVLDLTNLPSVPGFFSKDKRHRRARIFLRKFAKYISAPIDHDGREAIEYTPTQVVAEYFRHAYQPSDGDHVAGILYPSSVVDDGGCIVLFVGPDGVCDLKAWDGTDTSSVAMLDETAEQTVHQVQWHRVHPK